MLASLSACGTSTPPVTRAADPPPAHQKLTIPGAIPAERQRPGDPARGFDALLNRGYVNCGVPKSAFDRFFGAVGEGFKISGRTGAGKDLPYFANTFTAPSGVELVTANCFGCHASYMQGALVLGLGDAFGDFTIDTELPMRMGRLAIRDPAERAEWDRLAGRVRAIAPYMRTRTVGANPADHIAAALFAHRDPKTLAWSDEPLIEPPPRDPVPVDVPAWWLMKKKTAMFWTGGGRGDQARIMMTASVLCVDDVETAREVDSYFPDVRAWITSLEPPPFPGPIDRALAARGETVFSRRCARCHGTYGDAPAYPNKLVSAETVGTDPLLAKGQGQFAGRFVSWFNDSFYGEVARLEPQDGYVAPPLDGVWATAPYFHNGSVPNLAAVLDSTKRPATWVRPGRSREYDETVVGWPVVFPDQVPGVEDKRVYDTSRPGYGAAGHTFGDRLDQEERRALLEYLKSL